MLQWLVDNLFQVITVITIPITWFVSKRHSQKRDLKSQDVAIESNQSKIVSQNLDLYQKMLDDIERRYEDRIFKSDAEKLKLEEDIKNLKLLVQKLETKANELEMTVHSLNHQIINLKGKLDKYKNND